jgi:hypothetical protein
VNFITDSYRAISFLMIFMTGTWSLTLLQSATQSYTMGISGGYWYAVGGTLQIAIFSVVASKVKMNANRATTFPEVPLPLLIRPSPIERNPRWHIFGSAEQDILLFCGVVLSATQLFRLVYCWGEELL